MRVRVRVALFPLSRCLALIPYRLDIPFVNVMTSFEPWLLRSPALPSFVPFNMYRDRSPHMTFWERLDNAYRQMDWTLFPGVPYLEDAYLNRFLGGKPPIPINRLVGRALLWLIDTDFAIDYARPLMPNEVLIGGLTTQPGRPLPSDLEAFVNQSRDGVIVVSFGSMATNLPQEVRTKLLEAFSAVTVQLRGATACDQTANKPEHWLQKACDFKTRVSPNSPIRRFAGMNPSQMPIP